MSLEKNNQVPGRPKTASAAPKTPVKGRDVDTDVEDSLSYKDRQEAYMEELKDEEEAGTFEN